MAQNGEMIVTLKADKPVLDALEGILAELKAIHAVLEGPLPEMEDRDALLLKAETAADLRSLGLFRRD